MQRKHLILLTFLVTASISWCVYRDIQVEKQYTGDLRNRITGARLQKDGIAPYFYKWKKSDGIRYYDPQNFDSLKVSNITATPFFHQLLYPIVDLPQRMISKIWLVIEYILFVLMVAISLMLTQNKNQKFAVVLIACLFLYTNCWIDLTASGQVYIFFSFFSLIFFMFIRNNKNVFFATMAGVCAAILLLTRPNMIFFLLPFIFLTNRFSPKYLLVFFSSFLLFVLFVFGNKQNRLYWQDYVNAMTEQVRSHQQLHPGITHNEPDPYFNQWEGWNMKQIDKDAATFHNPFIPKHGNLFLIVNHAFKTKIPVWVLTITFLLSMLFLFMIYYVKNRLNQPFGIFPFSILCYCFYMLSDFFSPVYRNPYNGVQWLFPLLLIAAFYQPAYKRIYAGIMLGVLLNCLHIPFFEMGQTVGEYLILIFLLVFSITYKSQHAGFKISQTG
jgi:hypothetical protein